VYTRAPHQPVQHRLCLIIPMVGQCDDVRACACISGVASGARPCFEAVAKPIRQVNTFAPKRNIDAFANMRTMGRPIVGMGTDSVMHMQGGKRKAVLGAQADKQMEENGGIQPT
jgi:hypothetical protein